MLNKIKNKFIYLLFKTTKRLKFPFKSKRLLIVRLDAIGDYILFRNFIAVLKQHPVWGKYKFTLLGNRSFKELAEHVDSAYIDEFIWLNRNFSYQEYYNLCFLALKLKFKCFDVLINPVHSREAHIDEFCFAAGSKHLIGSAGDSFLFKDKEKKLYYDSLYNHLIPALDIAQFEFTRNRFFFKHLCGDDQITATAVPYKKSLLLKENCYNIILVPGAGSVLRQWSADNFASLVAQVNLTYATSLNTRFYIIGTKEDKENAKIIQQKTKATNVADLTGDTTLAELVDLIGSANLVISNETSSVHIAAATNTPAVCISNGNHFARFNPYPISVSKCITTIYPYDYFYNATQKEYLQLANKFSTSSLTDINLIKPEMVIKKVEKILETELKSSTIKT